MNTEIVLMVAAIAGALVLGLAVVLAILRALVSKARARVAAQIPADAILMVDWFANNFGVQSQGVAQLRGNGALVLTNAALHFFMFVPQRELKIPLAAITAVSSARSHLGKTVGRELLAVDFTNEAGATDRVAWLVRELDAWQLRLSEHTEHPGPPQRLRS
jgi:hypothetical protein